MAVLTCERLFAGCSYPYGRKIATPCRDAFLDGSVFRAEGRSCHRREAAVLIAFQQRPKTHPGAGDRVTGPPAHGPSSILQPLRDEIRSVA